MAEEEFDIDESFCTDEDFEIDESFCTARAYFNRGDVVTKTPCDDEFLLFLTQHLRAWTSWLGNKIVNMFYDATCNAVKSIKYNEDFKLGLLQARHGFEECRRLHVHPELFATESRREKFLSAMARLATIVGRIGELLLHLKSITKDDEAPDFNMQFLSRRPGRAVRHGYLKTHQPRFHPHAITKDDHWNKWLEPDHALLARDGWIQQRFTPTGTTIMANWRNIHRVIRNDFERRKRVRRATDKDMSELARETGDDYTLLKERKYIDRAGLGFFTGMRREFDKYGQCTVESLNHCLFTHEIPPQLGVMPGLHQRAEMEDRDSIEAVVLIR